MVYQKLMDSWHRFFKLAIRLQTSESSKNRDLSKFFLTNFFDEFLTKFFVQVFDKYFWQISLTNFLMYSFWRSFWRIFFWRIFWQIFWQIFFWRNFGWFFLTNFLINFLMNFLMNFLTCNLLTFASFSMGVPLILFWTKSKNRSHCGKGWLVP